MYQELFALEEEVFKVLANQKRLEIIQLLKKGELNVGDMTAMLGLRQPNLSQHLTLLRQHKLVATTKKGREIYYKLTDPNIAKAVDLIYRFLQSQHNVSSELKAGDIFPIVVDPVCGMRLSASEAFAATEYSGHKYYFCASGCKQQFEKQPANYTK
jgi:DNA-binding transcriptional ArsR family regulator/YHS domain-containing protein